MENEEEQKALSYSLQKIKKNTPSLIKKRRRIFMLFSSFNNEPFFSDVLNGPKKKNLEKKQINTKKIFLRSSEIYNKKTKYKILDKLLTKEGIKLKNCCFTKKVVEKLNELYSVVKKNKNYNTKSNKERSNST